MPVCTARMLRCPSDQNQGIAPNGDSRTTPTAGSDRQRDHDQDRQHVGVPDFVTTDHP